MKVLKYESLKDLPAVDDLLTFGEAAEDLGLTSERIRQMAQEGKLETARKIGRRPVGVVSESEIKKLVAEKQARADAAAVQAAPVPPAVFSDPV